jgi:hypothetical protein
MTLVSRLLAAALTCLLFAIAAPVLGQPATSPSEDDKAKARELFIDGNAKFDAQAYPAALTAYRAAHAIMNVPTTAYKVGKTLAAIGQLIQARDILLRVGQMPRVGIEPAAFAQARQSSAALADVVRGRIPSIRVEVVGVPADVPVTVVIDDKTLRPEVAHLPWRVNPGPHEVRGSAEGYQPLGEKVELEEGQTLVVKLSLRRIGEPSPPPPGGGISPLVWIGFGAGALGIIAGSISGAISLGKASDLEDGCDESGNCAPDLESDLDTAKTTATISTVSFVFAGVGVAVGAVGLLLSGEPSNEVAITPLIGPGYLGFTGRF